MKENVKEINKKDSGRENRFLCVATEISCNYFYKDVD